MCRSFSAFAGVVAGGRELRRGEQREVGRRELDRGEQRKPNGA